MRILKAGCSYFLIVFGAGFALAFVRLPFLVPHFGVRIAELLEAPIMLAVIVVASRRLARLNPLLDRGAHLLSGLIAFVLLVGAELLLAYALGARSPGDYIASRDPVSGSVYLASLVFFALAPAVWSNPSGADRSLMTKGFHTALLWFVAVATPAVIALPVGFVATVVLFPLWRWIESAHGIESIGHSGPADWCYTVTTLATFLALLALSLRIVRRRKLANPSS